MGGRGYQVFSLQTSVLFYEDRGKGRASLIIALNDTARVYLLAIDSATHKAKTYAAHTAVFLTSQDVHISSDLHPPQLSY